MKRAILVIDLGTTNVKATIMNELGETVSIQTLSTPVLYANGIMEIDVEELWRIVLSCCQGAVFSASERIHVDAVSISSMAASFVPVDREGNILSHAIGWADSRALPYMESYMTQFLQKIHIPGCSQYPLPMYAGFKLQWLKDNRPDIFYAVNKWLNVSELIYYRLTGREKYVTDYSIASRTMLFDVSKRAWNPLALDYFEINPDLLPEPLPAGTIIGTAAPETWGAGLSPDTKIVLGGHDHMCAIAGAGITQPGIVLNSTGTSEAVECLVPPFEVQEDIAFRWVNLECSVLPEQTAAVYYVGATGRVYQSACESMRDYDASYYPMPDGELIFIPPQRAQLPSVKGELKGIAPVFDTQKLTRAIRDGMYFECRRGIDRILQKSHVAHATMRCVGGHTKNRFEMQLKSDATGCVIELSRKEDIASKGAMILAGVGCGWYDSVINTARQMYDRTEKEYIYPDPERSKKYQEIYFERYLPQFTNGEASL